MNIIPNPLKMNSPMYYKDCPACRAETPHRDGTCQAWFNRRNTTGGSILDDKRHTWPRVKDEPERWEAV